MFLLRAMCTLLPIAKSKTVCKHFNGLAIILQLNRVPF